MLSQSYLLPKSLSPVKDLEQPVAFSSSTGGGSGEKDVEQEKEGREE